MSNATDIRLPIVGIGASAGGIEAFRGLFENMPPDSGLGFVGVLHLPADRKSLSRSPRTLDAHATWK